MTLPSYAVDFRGHPACPCLAEWLPVYESELQRLGLITEPLHIYQLIGGYSGSGGTHLKGGAFDILDLPGDEDQRLARDMGADATWARPYNWDGHGGIGHTHGVLRGCPHNEPARYQITAVDDGYDGLGYLGHGAPDPGPRPLSGRTWREGIKWANQQAQEAEDMQLNDKLYPGKDDSPTVGQVLRRMDKFMARQDDRAKAALDAIDALPEGVSKKDVRQAVQNALARHDAAQAQQ